MQDPGLQFSRKKMGHGRKFLSIKGADDFPFFIRNEFYFMEHHAQVPVLLVRRQ